MTLSIKCDSLALRTESREEWILKFNWQSTKGWSELLSRDFHAKVTATGAWRNAEERYLGKRVILIYIRFL